MGARSKQKEAWGDRYAEWKKSGQTQAAYCKSRGLNLWRFKGGVQRARRKGPFSDEVGDKRVGFFRVKLEGAGQAKRFSSGLEPFCEIRFSGKAGIRIETMESLALIRDLVRALAI